MGAANPLHLHILFKQQARISKKQIAALKALQDLLHTQPLSAVQVAFRSAKGFTTLVAIFNSLIEVHKHHLSTIKSTSALLYPPHTNTSTHRHSRCPVSLPLLPPSATQHPQPHSHSPPPLSPPPPRIQTLSTQT